MLLCYAAVNEVQSNYISHSPVHILYEIRKVNPLRGLGSYFTEDLRVSLYVVVQDLLPIS